MTSKTGSKKAERFSPRVNSASSIGLRLGLGLLVSLFAAWLVGLAWTGTASPAPPPVGCARCARSCGPAGRSESET